MRIQVLALILLKLYCASEVLAQEPAFRAALPDSVVVTATRGAIDARLTGRRITVFTAEEIRRMPASSFDELLRTLGGVEVQSRGGFGVQSDLTIRGSTFNGVLVLLDGARLNDPMTGHFLSDLPIPLAEVARIEILRGPASALYGPDALGGVIHLITYGALADPGAGPAFSDASLEASYGSYGTSSVGARASNFGERAAFGISGQWMRSDGMPIRSDTGQQLVSSEGPVRTDFDRHVYSGFATTELAGYKLRARAGFDTREFGAFQFYTPFPSDTAREATSTYWAQVATASPGRGPTSWSANVAARRHEDEYVYNPQTPANRHTSRLLSAQVQVDHALSRRLHAAAGVAGELRDISSNNLGNHGDASAGLFATGVLQPGSDITFTGGIRLNYDPAYGIEPTPQISAAYSLDFVTFRAAGGRAVRAPNYVERYINSMRANPAGGNLGNPDLRPESAWSAEAGVDLTPAAGLSLHLTGFRRTTSNLIDFALLSPADTVFLARNILNVTTSGVEIEVSGSRHYADGLFRAHVSYTGLSAGIGETEPGVQYKYALTHARHQLQGTAGWSFRGLDVSFRALYRKPLEASGYTVVDGRVLQRLPLRMLPVALSLEVRNIFDEVHTEIFGAPLPRRWLLAGIRIGR